MSNNFESMSIEELWALHEHLATLLAERLTSEKATLETRLDQLRQTRPDILKAEPLTTRRPYPAVTAKFRNPSNPSEQWSGRGKQPRWLVALLKSGKNIEEFRLPRKTDRVAIAGRGKRENK